MYILFSEITKNSESYFKFIMRGSEYTRIDNFFSYCNYQIKDTKINRFYSI